MGEFKGTLQAGISVAPVQDAQPEREAWKAPTLTTSKIEEETLTKTGSGDPSVV